MKSYVFFAVQAEHLNIIYTSFGLKICVLNLSRVRNISAVAAFVLVQADRILRAKFT